MHQPDRHRTCEARWPGSPIAGALLVVLSLLVGVIGVGGAPAADRDPCLDRPRAFFEDVGDAAIAAASVDCLVWHGLVDGVTYDRFGTGDPLRREQFASLLDRMITAAGVALQDPATAPFDDVGGVHGAAVGRLAEAGIIEGRSAGRFDPRSPVRRDQLASMIVRTYDVLVEPDVTSIEEVPHTFTDLTGNVHNDAIARAVVLDLVHGVTAVTFEQVVTQPGGRPRWSSPGCCSG